MRPTIHSDLHKPGSQRAVWPELDWECLVSCEVISAKTTWPLDPTLFHWTRYDWCGWAMRGVHLEGRGDLVIDVRVNLDKIHLAIVLLSNLQGMAGENRE